MSRRFAQMFAPTALGFSALLPEEPDPTVGGSGGTEDDPAAKAAAEAAAATAAAEEAVKVAELPDWARAAITKANSEAAAARIKVRELTPLAAKAKELEDATKTDIEKATEKLTAAEARAVKAEGDLLRLEVAAEKGLTAAQAKRLSGSTKAELEADADELLETFGGKQDPAPLRRRPSANLRGGSNPDDDPEETDPVKLAAKVPRRY